MSSTCHRATWDVERPNSALHIAHMASYRRCQDLTAWRDRGGHVDTSEYAQVLRDLEYEADLAWSRRNLDWNIYQYRVMGQYRSNVKAGAAPVTSIAPVQSQTLIKPVKQKVLSWH